jgi:hypothetical protein
MKSLWFFLLWLPLAGLAAEPAKFADALHKKFQNPRCLQCHQFNSKRSNGRAYASHRSRYLCDNCHTQRITGLPRGEWMAPAEKLDYSGLGPVETCRLIKRNMGNGDVDTKLARHLLEDIRIRWALENGMTPLGRFATVPGGYEEWARDVRTWIDGGMLCE